MNAFTIIIISFIVGILLLSSAIIIKLISIKKRKHKETFSEQKLNDKTFFKNHKIIKYKNFKKHDSGIVISSGIKSLKTIKNSFVIKNLEFEKNNQIYYKKLSICKTKRISSICIAPPGSGKTQALLLPTIFYMLNCEEKPNLIVTDPKPEIYEKLNFELFKNKYKVINLSTIEIQSDNGKFFSDYWNPLENIIEFHKRLLSNNDKFIEQDLLSKIERNINKITSYFKLDEKPDYWKDNAICILSFMIALFLLKIEFNEMTYDHLNLFNIKSNLDIITNKKLLDQVNLVKQKINNECNNIKTLKIISKFLSFSHEREENISSFLTNTLGFLACFGETYLATLTSKTTFNLDAIIESNKPFIIFLTINTASTAHINEKILLKIWLSMINEKIDFYKRNNLDFQKRSIWWLLDEAGNLTKLDFLKSIISFGRGRNEFALPIFQSDAQMQSIYGTELIESAENKIMFSIDNDKLGQKISNISGTNFKFDEYGRKLVNKNVELENIVNIRSGYLGLWTYRRKQNSKNFYICPITFWYMLKGTSITTKLSLKSNSKYLLDNHIKFIDQVEISKKKKAKYDWLNIEESIYINNLRAKDILNHIVNHLNYFKSNKELNIKKIQNIKEEFLELQKITKNKLEDSLISQFLDQAQKNNINILENYEENQEK